MYSIFKTFILSLLMVAQVHFAYAQNASILPPAKTTFLGNDGKPLTSGTVDFYIPSTTIRKTTWQDSAATIPNTNPVVLDAAGRALILGNGSYRQIVKDRLGNVVWDQNTASTGSGGGGGSSTGDGNAVGTVQQYTGFVAPSNYAFTYGQEVSRSTYAVLLSTITITQSINCTSGNATLTTIADTTQLNIGAAVEAACVPAGATIISKTVNSVTLSANATVTTTVSAVFFPWGNGNGLTTFNIPDFRGKYLPGRNNMGGAASASLAVPFYTDPNSINGSGGGQSQTLLISNLPSHVHPNTISDPGHFHIVPNVSSGIAGGADITVGAGSHGVDNHTGTSSSNLTLNNFAAGGGIAVSAIVGSGGSGYTAGTQLLTVSGGTCTIQPQFNVTISAGAITAPVLVTAGQCSITPSNPVATTGGGGTGGTLNVTYSAVPFTTLPPSRTVNYIIKVLPDIFPSATAVTSIQGMTGAITCAGSAIVCAGNVITVNIPSTGVSSLGSMTGAIGCGAGLTCAAGTISVTNNNNIYVIPSDYGFTCDGVTNVATAFQTMVTASTGKTIFIPPGPACIINTTITLPTNTTITGGGREVSVVSGNALPLFSAVDKTNISLTNFWMKGTRNVVSPNWASSPVGAISFTQTVAAVSDQYLTIKNMKFSNFNTSYWFYIVSSTNNFFNIKDFRFENNYILTAAGDIPADANPLNNNNYGLYLLSSSAGKGRIDNPIIKNNIVESTGLCLPFNVTGNSYKLQFTENLITNPGVTNPSVNGHCLSGDGITSLSYGLNVYDAWGDGNPPTNFLVSSNTIIAPYGTGIYIVGDGTVGHTASVYNSSGSLVSNNLIDGQVSQVDTTLPRAAIVIALMTDISVIGNKVRNNFGGITASSQTVGEVSIIGNSCTTNVAAGASTPYCYKITAGLSGSGGANVFLKGNYGNSVNTSAGNVISLVSATGSRFNSVEISENTIIAGFNGLASSNQWFNGLYTVTGNKFQGGAAGAMINIATLNGSSISIRDNVYFNSGSGVSGDLFANLPTTAINGSNVYLSNGTAGSTPCTGGGTGSTAYRQNGAWKCF